MRTPPSRGSPVTRPCPAVYGRSWHEPLDDRPPPPGTVPADPSRQNHGMWAAVHFYADQERLCSDCSETYVFTAVEQRHWYEDLGFTFDAFPIACAPCRRRRRFPRILNARLSEATASYRENPDDADAVIAWAEATVALHEATGSGNLDRLVGVIRRACGRFEDDVPLVRFWAGRVAEARGDRPEAIEHYRRFVEDHRTNRRREVRRRRGDAERRIVALRAAGPRDP